MVLFESGIQCVAALLCGRSACAALLNKTCYFIRMAVALQTKLKFLVQQHKSIKVEARFHKHGQLECIS